MKKTLIHCRWMVMELLRQPAYVVATLGFPSIFYLIFAVPESKTEFGANLLLGSFSVLQCLGSYFCSLELVLLKSATRRGISTCEPFRLPL